MKDKLDELILENFRIFEGRSTFKFADLNIFTGPNNSGKSSVIKAIKFFMEGLEKADFPALNLLSTKINLGGFDNVIHRGSEQRDFRIGFKTKIQQIEDSFNVIYTFSDGGKDNRQFLDTALFSDLEIIDKSGKVFFGIYTSLSPIYKEWIKAPPIEFPSDKGDPGILQFRLDLDLLEHYIGFITKKDFSSMQYQLRKIQGSDNCWWGECFHEYEYSEVNYNIYQYSLSDFESELHYDIYTNLAEYNLKELMLFQDDVESEREKYHDLKEKTKYSEFIRYVIHPIFESIKFGLNLFRKDNIIHITPTNLQERLISNNEDCEYLQRIYREMDTSENLFFIRNSLSMFNIDGLIEIIPYVTTSFEINLITDVERSVDKRKDQFSKGIEVDNISTGKDFYFTNPNFDSLSFFSENKRINIADLGKGASNVIKLILKTASILFSFENEKMRNVSLPKLQGRKPRPVVKKTILIEEPEAFLHPNWQSSLIDFFLFCQRMYDVQFIIETHSEYLIRKLQYFVATNIINPSDISLYYFSEKKNVVNNEECVIKINILEDGGLDKDFGQGFFDEAINLKLEIFKLKNSQKN